MRAQSMCSSGPDITALADLEIETDALFDVLASSRRRFVLSCLSEYRTPMALADVADEVATWEHEGDIQEIAAEEIKSIYLSLYHSHIPKMEDVGLVDYSQERDTVALVEDGKELISAVNLPPIE